MDLPESTFFCWGLKDGCPRLHRLTDNGDNTTATDHLNGTSDEKARYPEATSSDHEKGLFSSMQGHHLFTFQTLLHILNKSGLKTGESDWKVYSATASKSVTIECAEYRGYYDPPECDGYNCLHHEWSEEGTKEYLLNDLCLLFEDLKTSDDVDGETIIKMVPERDIMNFSCWQFNHAEDEAYEDFWRIDEDDGCDGSRKRVKTYKREVVILWRSDHSFKVGCIEPGLHRTGLYVHRLLKAGDMEKGQKGLHHLVEKELERCNHDDLIKLLDMCNILTHHDSGAKVIHCLSKDHGVETNYDVEVLSLSMSYLKTNFANIVCLKSILKNTTSSCMDSVLLLLDSVTAHIKTLDGIDVALDHVLSNPYLPRNQFHWVNSGGGFTRVRKKRAIVKVDCENPASTLLNYMLKSKAKIEISTSLIPFEKFSSKVKELNDIKCYSVDIIILHEDSSLLTLFIDQFVDHAFEHLEQADNRCWDQFYNNENSDCGSDKSVTSEDYNDYKNYEFNPYGNLSSFVEILVSATVKNATFQHSISLLLESISKHLTVEYQLKLMHVVGKGLYASHKENGNIYM